MSEVFRSGRRTSDPTRCAVPQEILIAIAAKVCEQKEGALAAEVALS